MTTNPPYTATSRNIWPTAALFLALLLVFWFYVLAEKQGLGLSVIAEGVEMAEQRDFLAQAGCHAYQGYFFSRPLPIEGFEAFARQG